MEIRRRAWMAIALLLGITACYGAESVFYAAGRTNDLLPLAGEFASYCTQTLGREVGVQAATHGGPKFFMALATDMPSAAAADGLQALSAMDPEAYLLDADPARILIAGNSALAVQHGMFEILERLGWRWLQPGTRWTVVPRGENLHLAPFHVLREPRFRDRRIWYAYGCGLDESKDVLERDYRLWHRASRLGGLARFECGHSYPHTVGAYADEFQAHPEYFAMTEDGQRLPFATHQSLCYSNPDVARIFIEHRLADFREKRALNPYAFMVSMDPNDGSQACSCESCRALGNGSDQVIYLANQVARALAREFPGVTVGLYLYASHKLPPLNVRPEPNVYGQLAMAFNRSGLSYQELAEGWRAAGLAALGIREYFGVMAWDWGLPGRGRGSSLSYMARMIPVFEQWGATSFNAEINANWGTFGPAVYTAARLMWDRDADAEAVCDEYFRAAFGRVAEDMRRLYDGWQEDQKLTRSNLHRWLGQLQQAIDKAAGENDGVRGRLEDMAAYLHYAVLFSNWELAERTGDRDRAYAALKPLLTFTWRIRERQVVHAYALQRRLVNSGATVLRPLAEGWRFNDPAAIWKDATPVTGAELLALLSRDVAAYPPDDRLVAFSGELVPLEAEALGQPAGGCLRRKSVWHLVSPAARACINLAVEDGQLEAVELLDAEGLRLAEHRRENGDDLDKPMVFELPAPGRYRLILSGGEYRPIITGVPCIAAEASERYPLTAEYFGSGYVFVPAGVKTLRAEPGARLSLQAPSWPERRDFVPADIGAAACIEIPVGEDAGRVWRIDAMTRGAFYFYNVPPYVATDPALLPVPTEVLPTRTANE